MVYFPLKVFKLICEFCDDRLEQRQKFLWSLITPTNEHLPNEFFMLSATAVKFPIRLEFGKPAIECSPPIFYNYLQNRNNLLSSMWQEGYNIIDFIPTMTWYADPSSCRWRRHVLTNNFYATDGIMYPEPSDMDNNALEKVNNSDKYMFW